MTERLDLAEGKRLLSEATPEEWRVTSPFKRVGRDIFSRTFVRAIAQNLGPEDAAAIVWLHDNADSLIAAAEDAETLRELLREARFHGNLHADYCDCAADCITGPSGGCVCGGTNLYVRIDSALTQPEPTTARPSGDG